MSDEEGKKSGGVLLVERGGIAVFVFVLALFVARYHILMLSDSLTDIQLIRKQSMGFPHTIVNVPRIVSRYNYADPVEQRAMEEEDYIFRRLKQTGMIQPKEP